VRVKRKAQSSCIVAGCGNDGECSALVAFSTEYSHDTQKAKVMAQGQAVESVRFCWKVDSDLRFKVQNPLTPPKKKDIQWMIRLGVRARVLFCLTAASRHPPYSQLVDTKALDVSVRVTAAVLW